MKYVIVHNNLGRHSERFSDAGGLVNAVNTLEKNGALLMSVQRENAPGNRFEVWSLKDDEKYDDGVTRLKHFAENL